MFCVWINRKDSSTFRMNKKMPTFIKVGNSVKYIYFLAASAVSYIFPTRCFNFFHAMVEREWLCHSV